MMLIPAVLNYVVKVIKYSDIFLLVGNELILSIGIVSYLDHWFSEILGSIRSLLKVHSILPCAVSDLKQGLIWLSFNLQV